ncbi:probable myosin-binding protein 5 isoform X1 [Sesamum indicum]|uniref:Probable myosin-binding protein 5 isoform X1 n=1 Tax=Sesamum indicum TaxID=4182 RepID=A0A6I9SRC9_SESIN|nr:probable myosin-binding protein 5 isoform X1 [Sesamum indicum]
MPVGSFRSFVEQKLGTFPHFLVYVVFEWVVIILLFIDGFLAFVSNEIARFFELRIPCLLCTRIDHVLVHRDSNFYYNESICEIHKKDISSLAYCNVHKKLSDIRCMCQGCLLSFATEKGSDFDKYKSLVGILHKDADYFVEDDRKLLVKPLKKDDSEIASDEKSEMLRCSCCGEPLKSRSSTKYSRSLSMSAPAPSPRASLFGSRNEEGGNMDLPSVRYTELKLVADNELELPEDEDAANAETQAVREDVKAARVPLLPDTEDLGEDAARTPSFTRGNKFFGIPLSDTAQMSPRWANRASKKLTVDKLDFILDAHDATEPDGNILTRLKRQVRMDRKALTELYMELDEERSAAAVAANNAMAMITRLQAEKAAVQMEASQYQRMMEEQAEYDQEALQLMKDMLFKRDEDIKALEAELEMYREKYGHIKKIGSEICEIDAEDDYQDMKSQALSMFSDKSDGSSSNGADRSENEHAYEQAVEYGGGVPDVSTLDFEGERSYLLSLLGELEQKINSPSDEISNPTEVAVVMPENEGRGNENRGMLTREVSMIRERLRAIEAESGFLKHAAMTLQQGGEGTKLLTEIAQHLRKLRHPVKSPSEATDA